MTAGQKAVYFVGAGPGDPELITVKGRSLLERADRVLYAGSLVPKDLLKWCRSHALKQNTASMTLEEIIAHMVDGWKKGELVVRLHTGDPSLYGAVQEQFRELDQRGIPYEVIPGVTAAFLGAARLKREFTIASKTQTLILTRVKNRTPVPDAEDLDRLAGIGSSMVIYLSIKQIEQVAHTLARHYGKEAPVAIGYRLGMEGEKVIIASLEEIASKVRLHGIERHAIIMVGPFLKDVSFVRSRLYSPDFTHGFRS